MLFSFYFLFHFAFVSIVFVEIGIEKKTKREKLLLFLFLANFRFLYFLFSILTLWCMRNERLYMLSVGWCTLPLRLYVWRRRIMRDGLIVNIGMWECLYVMWLVERCDCIKDEVMRDLNFFETEKINWNILLFPVFFYWGRARIPIPFHFTHIWNMSLISL